MVSWPEAIERISLGAEPDQGLKRARLPRLGSAPVAILGGSGSGKTRIWSALTSRPLESAQMSIGTDDGYFFRKHKTSAALRTIPGQSSRTRYLAVDEMFGSEARVKGIIFIASYGFDHVWPQVADAVGSNLTDYSLNELRNRNLREEFKQLQEVCSLIKRKYTISGSESSPQWVLILINKIDLFWQERDDAVEYYMGETSRFRTELAALTGDLGSLTGPSVHFVPATTEPRDYVFVSRRGELTAPSTLGQNHCSASLRCLMDQMEELLHGTS